MGHARAGAARAPDSPYIPAMHDGFLYFPAAIFLGLTVYFSARLLALL